MSEDLLNLAIEFMRHQNWSEALKLFEHINRNKPDSPNVLYMAGQCRRFLGDIDGAIKDLERAVVLGDPDPPMLLALGIAYQLNSQFDDAIRTLRRAIELDNDYDLAFNSLALTQKKCGELEKASANYDQGLNALTRKIVKQMQNSRENSILKSKSIQGSLWWKYASYGALYLASMGDIDSILMPTGASALEEEKTERHGGLYWDDSVNENNQKTRLFLPNYFNTFNAALKRNSTYINLIGNRGAVLELLDCNEEAKQHFLEVSELSI